MPPPKKPKTKESWEEFISESQAESSVDKQGDSLGSHKTDSQPFNSSVGIQGKEPADCSERFTRPEALVTLVPEDLSMKLDRNGCLKTLSNSIQEVLKETIIANGNAHIQDRSLGAEHHPQLRNILLQASSDPILLDVGENLVSSGGGLQDLQVTRIHSRPSGSPNSSKILWKNPSMHASTNELQPLTAFSTNLPSGGNNRDEVCLLDSSGRDREQNPRSCMQIKQEESCRFRMGRGDQNPSSGNTVRGTWPHVTVIRDGGHTDSDHEQTSTERYSASQTNGVCNEDRRNGLGPQAPTADSTTHMVFNQLKRSRLNGERVQARHQAFQSHRGQNSANERSVQEPHARGPTTNDRICAGQGNLEQQHPRNPAPEFKSNDIESHSQMTIARLFTELHRKDIPVMEYFVSLDDKSQQSQGQNGAAERILSQILPRAFQGVSRIQRSPQTPLNGKPQTEQGGFGQRKVENGLVIANKLFPTSPPPTLDLQAKMATLRELLCDDSGPSVASGCATPSCEVNRVNIDDSGAAHRLQETGDVGRSVVFYFCAKP